MATITSINIAFYNDNKDHRKKLAKKLDRKIEELLLNEGFYKAEVSSSKVVFPYVRFDVNNVAADSKEQLEALTVAIVGIADKACNFRGSKVRFRQLAYEFDTAKGATTRSVGRRIYNKMVK